MNNGKIETDPLKYTFDPPGFYCAELRIPPAAFSGGNTQPASDPYLFLRVYPRTERRHVLRLFIWSAAGSFLQRAIWLLYADLRIHWLFQRYFYQILL